MIERNFKNNLVFEDAEDRLSVAPLRDEYDLEQLANFFDVNVSAELLAGEEVLEANVEVIGRCSALSGGNLIEGVILKNGPFSIFRDGEEIESGLAVADFPYLDENNSGGCYRIENVAGNSDTICCE